jgi:deoxyribodipyrimidine photolyase-related protein
MGMGSTLFLFSHQLHPRYLEVASLHAKITEIIFVDSDDQWQQYRFHQQRILLHLSAMYHYALELKNAGWQVQIIQTKSLIEALKNYPKLIVFKPTNHYEQAWVNTLNNVDQLPDPLFLITEPEWTALLPVNKPWKLDTLYRQFRQRFSILMDDGQPIGGQYSFDAENRKPPKKGMYFLPPQWVEKDDITQQLEAQVQQRFHDHPGTTKTFAYPVTRQAALNSFQHFLHHRLPTFGLYQDAMLKDQPWMSHSLISSSINLGLLSPQEVIDAAVRMFKEDRVPLEAAEGFIRQILGWREYVRGVYLVLGPDYLSANQMQHHQPLPAFFYDANTEMFCLKTTIKETIEHAYNHHIQRLMVLSNYANLTNTNPFEVNRWFNEMYIDSSEWVVAANVIGMGQYADGGRMSTKPYISSGAYIHKMSDYCDSCAYQVTLKTGEKACPFNSLYWHYLFTHKKAFQGNPRMTMMLSLLDKMSPTDQAAMLDQAKTHLKK